MFATSGCANSISIAFFSCSVFRTLLELQYRIRRCNGVARSRQLQRVVCRFKKHRETRNKQQRFVSLFFCLFFLRFQTYYTYQSLRFACSTHISVFKTLAAKASERRNENADYTILSDDDNDNNNNSTNNINNARNSDDDIDMKSEPASVVASVPKQFIEGHVRLSIAFEQLLAMRANELLPDALLRDAIADLNITNDRATFASTHCDALQRVLASLGAIVDSAPSCVWSHAAFGGANARGPQQLRFFLSSFMCPNMI